MKKVFCNVKKLPTAPRYILGYSGGRDSHVLLDLLCRLRDSGELDGSLTAIHVNHNLNPKALDWVEHCQAICDAYDVSLIVETVAESPKKSDSIEAFAREARYRLIEKNLHESEIFLSAHHQRDQAETFLLQLMRGAGLGGLRAMPVVRPLGEGRYFRPMLDVNYADVVAYAEGENLDFINDDSNDDTRFDRNFVRHEVLPILEKRFPKVHANISQSARWLSEVPDLNTPERLVLDDLLSHSEIAQKHQIRAFIKSKTGRSLSQTQTTYLMTHHLHAKADKHPTLNLGDFVVRRHGGEICVTANLPPNIDVIKNISLGQVIVVPPVGKIVWRGNEGLITDELLTVKALRSGERFQPHTRSCTTTIKKCLNEARIPVWLRPYYVGLYLDNELLAIPGVGVAKKYYKKSIDARLPLWQISPKFVRM